MQIERIEVFSFPVPFKMVFRHASASRSQAENLIVAVHSKCGQVGYGEGCPRPYVTGETVRGAQAFVAEVSESIRSSVADAATLRDWTNTHRALIDQNPAAYCAVELAVLDLLGNIGKCSVEATIGEAPLSGEFQYSAVLGDAPYLAYWWQFRRYWNDGFRDFKIKVSGNARRDARKVRLIGKRGDRNSRIRLDANNLWVAAEDCIRHLGSLSCDIFAVEEPLRAGDISGFRKVGRECGAKIVLDESLLRPGQLEELEDRELWIVNLRISKMGGILRSLELARLAADMGIGIIVGSQVGETSILTRAALTVMNACGQNLVAAEGAFGTHLLERDLTEPSLQFGNAGIISSDHIRGDRMHGLGLTIRSQELVPA